MSKDLFDDSTMSFGEHLEVLREHLWKALIGIVICTLATLSYSKPIIDLVRAPIDNALADYGQPAEKRDSRPFWDVAADYFNFSSDSDSKKTAESPPDVDEENESDENTRVVSIELDVVELQQKLHDANPQRYPAPAKDAKPDKVKLQAKIPGLPIADSAAQALKPITINVQEAFFTYVKVALISGLVLSSPWVFYQMWLFVAAGLYPHERKWVYRFLPLSIGLFLAGAAFCFIYVIPVVLQFLLSFNAWLGLMPQIRMSEWISFAVMMPLMFGLSFQLPLVMLFMERISIFTAQDYRDKRRISILVIAILSMLLTPSDPSSMLMMMIPLLLLYELGIWICSLKKDSASPFGDEGG